VSARCAGPHAAWPLRLLAAGALCLVQGCTNTDVTGVTVASVTVSPASATLLVGETGQFSAEVRDVDGAVLPSSVVTWSSGDASIASVGSDGRAVALHPGTTEIRATARGVTGTATLTVEGGPEISVDAESLSFVARRQGTNPDPVDVAVVNGGNGTLSGLSASTAYAAGEPTGWLSLALSSTAAPATLTVSAAIGSLASGTYHATVTLRAPAAEEDVQIQVELTLTEDQPILRLSPTAVGFAGVAGSSPPAPQVVQVTNEGSGTLTDLEVSVTYGGTGGWLSTELSSTTAPASLTIHADPKDLVPGSYSATVQVSSPVVADEPRTVSVSFTVDDKPLADLSVGLAGPAEIIEGDSALFVVTLANAGPRDAVSVMLVDSLPTAVVSFARASGGAQHDGGVVTWPARIVSSGTTIVDTLWVVGTGLGSAVNVVTVSSVTVDPSMTNNRAEAGFRAVTPPADVGLTKIGPATAEAGDEITYLLDVTYVGGRVAAEDVRITDALPSALIFVSATGGGTYDAPTRTVSWNLGEIPIGGSTSARLTVRIAPTAFGSITNAATVTTSTRDPDSTNDVGADVTAVAGTVDLALTKSGPASASAGARITYTLRVEHVDGPATATGVVVTDVLPSALTYVSATGGGAYDATDRTVTWTLDPIAPGESRTVQLTADIGSSFTGDISNTARVSTSTRDGDPDNDASTVVTSVSLVADVAVDKSGPATASPGSTIAYSIAVDHVGGTSDATGVVVTDALPAGLTFVSASGGGTWDAGSRTVTWSLGTLAVGSRASLSLSAGVPDGATGTVVNHVSVTSTSSDPVPGNNTSSVSTEIPHVADLALTKSAPAVDTAGSRMVYNLTVRNVDGPDDAQDVVVTDPLPTGVTFVSATGGGTASGGVVTWNLGGLAVGASASVSVTVAIDSDRFVPVTNTASVSAASVDPEPGNNTASATTTVEQVADLSIDKSTASTSVPQLAEFSYTIRVTNESATSGARGLTIVDAVPSALTFVSASGGGTESGGVVQWSIATLAPGASAERSLTVRTSSVIAPVTNTARVSSTSTDPNPANDSSSATVSVITAADVTLTLTAEANATAGDSLHYTIVLTNESAVPSQLDRLTTVLPSALAFVSATDGGTWDEATRTVSWTSWPGGGLAGHGSLTRGVVAEIAAGTSGNVSTTAAITSETPDPDPTNNSDTFVTSVTAASPAPRSMDPIGSGMAFSSLRAEAMWALPVYAKGMTEPNTPTQARPSRPGESPSAVPRYRRARPR